MGTSIHRSKAAKNLNIGIITVSTSRTLKDDKSGLWIRKRAEKEGHTIVFHQVVTDAEDAIGTCLLDVIESLSPHALLITGGTGLSPKDVTIEAVRPYFKKELTAFGPIFAQLSYEQIDSAAILSRATAGIIKQTTVFCMPGSLKAVQLACRALIFPDLGHLIMHTKE
ncbi:MAG: molybdenum cofactor biosynthesis protein MoaB [Desulfobacteraceae bacterium]|nr:molybdenum cofactor biosynthesis protein MoaB [Desulfobacteraceae bacterium]